MHSPLFNTPRAMALCLLCCLLWPAAALAHKVTVFAYVDGPNIVVDAFYSKSNKVNKGTITVMNAASGEEYARAVTDEAGALALPVPAKAVAAKADLRVLLVAGEGHQDEILVKASEFAALSAAAAKAAPAPQPQAKLDTAKSASKTAPESGKAPSSVTAAPAQIAPIPLDEATLTRIVNNAVEQAVDSRMAPVKRLLLESAQKGPGMTEIIGGIGYIVGLFGVAAFVAGRRKGGSGK